jgi:hypothetical protein
MQAKKQIEIQCLDKRGYQYSILVAAKKEVCPECDGEGKILPYGIDQISDEDLAKADIEFLENYKGGVFHLECESCKGNKIVVVPDSKLIPNTCLEDYIRAQSAELEKSTNS